MKRRKRGSSIAIALVLSLLLASCGGSSNPTSGTTTSKGETTAPVETTTEALAETTADEGEEPGETSDNGKDPSGEESDYRYQDFVYERESSISYPLNTDKELSIWTTALMPHQDYASEAESPFHQNLMKQTGVKIEYQRPAAGADPTQAFNMMLASGNLPDIIYTDTLHLKMETLIADGHALVLDELMPAAAPDAYALIEQYPELNKALRTDSGRLTAFPFLRGDPWLGNWLGQAVDKNVLAETGLDIPETIEDWDEFLRAAKEIVDIPLALRTGYGLHEMFSNAYNFAYSFYVGDDERIHLGYAEPAYKDFLIKMNEWYEAGLIDPDFVTMDTAGLRTKVINNSIGGIQIATGTFINYYVARQEIGETFDFVPAPVPVSRVDGKKKYFPGESPWFGNGAIITTAAEDPELAAQFLNYGYTKDGMVFWNFGLEGETFEYVDGMPQLTSLITDAAEGATSALNRYSAMGASGFSVMMKELNEQKNVPVGEGGERLGNLAGDVWTDGTDGVRHRIPAISPTLEENQEFSAIQNALDTYAAEMYYNFILGTEPIENFDSYIQTLEELSLSRALEIRNAQLDRYDAR